MLKQRVITAIILLALFLLALFALPTIAWTILVLAIVMQGTAEWARLSGLGGRAASGYWWLTFVVMLGMLWFDSNFPADLQTLPHLALYGVSALLWVIVVPTWMMMGWKLRNPWLMGMVGWAVLLPTGLAMMDLRAASPWWLLGLMALVWVADTAAYFAGRKFGKHKLAPAISPGKTWEGVAGAILGVSVYVLLAGWFSGLYKEYPIFPGVIVASWWWVVLAVIGDLFESVVKRQAGVKDSGALLPGHGGLLDRIDALTSTLPLAALTLLLQRLA